MPSTITEALLMNMARCKHLRSSISLQVGKITCLSGHKSKKRPNDDRGEEGLHEAEHRDSDAYRLCAAGLPWLLAEEVPLVHASKLKLSLQLSWLGNAKKLRPSTTV